MNSFSDSEKITVLLTSDGTEEYSDYWLEKLLTSLYDYELRTGCSVDIKCFISSHDQTERFRYLNDGMYSACRKLGAGEPIYVSSGQSGSLKP